eukprot:scaffold2572_cov75-Skeletonema_marinoi.AAC.17
MPRPKKARLIDASSEAAVVLPPRRSRRIAGRPDATFDDLGVDVLALILGFLGPFDIMRSRVCKKICKVATTAIVPLTECKVDKIEKVHALRAMSTALANLQQLDIRSFGIGHHKYSDGEERDEEIASYYVNPTTHDIEILSSFRKLRILEIHYAPLNGRYPFLFQFPLLQKLKIHGCNYLKWDLGMLAGLPLLKELFCTCNRSLIGSINSLRVLKDTLEMVDISGCPHVAGNFMDLADFPRLKTLIMNTGVIGDIRDIGERDFTTLESLILPSGVYGGMGYQFQRISDAPGVISALYSIKKQRPSLLIESWHAFLSEDSPDWYDGIDGITGIMDYEYMDYDEIPAPPMYIVFVEAGSRIGYRWESADSQHPCEVNWLDPEPDRESNDYEKYTEELHKIERQVNVYRGFHQPPSETEYQQFCEEMLF